MQENSKREAKPLSEEVDVFVGKQIRLYRKLRGFSQTSFADQLGVSFQQVQKYEKGMNRVSAGRLYDMARVLGIGVEQFFHSDSDVRFTNDNDAFVQEFDKEILELVRLYKAIESESLKKSLIKMIRMCVPDS